jgi:AcrR family transcriptional regulator
VTPSPATTLPATAPASSLTRLEALRADSSNRGRLLQAALEQIDRIGIDNITASDLIGQAGVSRSTLYSYFGEVLGVLAEVWAECGAEWLQQVVDDPTAAHRDRSIDAAMVALLCTARRAPLLHEVVQPDVEALWADLATRGPIGQMKAIWLLAALIGTELTVPIMPEASVVEGLTALVASMPDNVAQLVGSLDEALQTNGPTTHSPVLLPDDSVTARLTKAAVEVVASSGLEAASMMRVCRVARLSTGAATPRFAGLRALHERAFAEANAEVIRSNADQFARFVNVLSPPDVNALYVRSSLSESRRLWRNYRRELHLAARHDADLATMMRTAFSDSNRSLRNALSRSEAPAVVIDVAIMFNQVYSVGLGAVADLGLPVDSFDHRIVVRWLYLHVIGQPPTT